MVWVWAVYSPKTHTTTAMWPLGGFLDGVVDARPDQKKIVFYDVSESPADWFTALAEMDKILNRIRKPSRYTRGLDVALDDCEGERIRLFNAYSNDVVVFKSRYCSTPYQSPKYVKAEDDYRVAHGRTFGAWADHFKIRHSD